MIEGLKFVMPSDELRSYLAGRAEHHRARQIWYETKANELEEGDAEGPANVSNSPVPSLRAKAAEHAQKVEMFAFMAAHVTPHEEYWLADADLVRIEILKRVW